MAIPARIEFNVLQPMRSSKVYAGPGPGRGQCHLADHLTRLDPRRIPNGTGLVQIEQKVVVFQELPIFVTT